MKESGNFIRDLVREEVRRLMLEEVKPLVRHTLVVELGECFREGNESRDLIRAIVREEMQRRQQHQSMN